MSNLTIPPIIHSVWVGGGKKSPLMERCIASWSRHLAGYTFVEWNESNFDIEAVPFVAEAYAAKKWAFVSDYIRAHALYTQGGIYLDTDNLVLTSLDAFRKHRAFVGFERPEYPFTACFGAEAGHPLVKDILDYYEGRSFVLDPDDPLSANNTLSVSELLIEKYGAKTDNTFQILSEGIALYPDTVLCNPSADSSVLHIFTGTWLGGHSRKRQFVTELKSYLDKPWKAELYRKIFRNG